MNSIKYTTMAVHLKDSSISLVTSTTTIKKKKMVTLSSSSSTSSKIIISIFMTLFFMLNIKGSEGCYFPIEYQGTFLIQTQGVSFPNNSTSQVTYSEVVIEADAIQPWGRCHKSRGNNIILKDSTGSGQDCLRCFHLSIKTPNVFILHTDGFERCYTNEEAARATCPLDKDIQQKKFKEIILFRKHIPGGLQSIEHVFCPFNGRYRFSYKDQTGQMKCDFGYSEISNCPHGNALNVKFRKCTFSTIDIHFLCLGDWESPDPQQRYVALLDLRETLPKADRPKYRCGLYKEYPNSGQFFIALSSDSTCSTNLQNYSSGFETLVLNPIKRPPPIIESNECSFLEWMQGRWQRTRVEGQEFIHKDEKNQFRTIRSRCIMRKSDISNDRFLVHSTTQCGEQFYTCLWVKRRSPNIMEFRYSDKQSNTMDPSLCNYPNFVKNQWITEGKEKILALTTPCPITGDYTGEVPGAAGLCAKVASDCNNPDIMFYSVSSCENRSHVFEEREYRCLGNWEEDGVLYTFTQRRDMPGHQCFAGLVYQNGDQAYIKESGESCMRGEEEDPFIYGMRIDKQASCPRHIVPKVMILPPIKPAEPKYQPKNPIFSYPPMIRPLTISPPPMIMPASKIDHQPFKPIQVDRHGQHNNNNNNNNDNNLYNNNNNANHSENQNINYNNKNNANNRPSSNKYPRPPLFTYEPAELPSSEKTINDFKPMISNNHGHDRDRGDKINFLDVGSSSLSSLQAYPMIIILTLIVSNILIWCCRHHL